MLTKGLKSPREDRVQLVFRNTAQHQATNSWDEVSSPECSDEDKNEVEEEEEEKTKAGRRPCLDEP